jgi:RNA polymerase sigma-54 factor
MARMTGVSVEEVKQAITYIRSRLNPFPASQFRPPWTYRPSNSKSTVRPDVIIRSTQLGYEVDVLGMEPLCLSVSNIYRDTYNLIKSGEAHLPDDEKKHFVEYVERAELFIRNVTQRLHTLRQITKAIIDVQTGFLETGSRQFLRPLTRTRIAQMLSMHESTVSRATANKYVQLPNQEVIGFDVFFNSSLSVKDAILELLQDEDPAHPLSDKRIAEILRERGLIVERRTVVKYREALKILSSTRRRG